MSEPCTPQRNLRDVAFVEKLQSKQLDERYPSFPPVEAH
jgi:hypothetical protein